MEELYTYVRETPSLEDAVVASTGDAAKALAGAARPFDAEYTTAVQTHGSIGPSCAVADVKDGSATVWSGTQGPNVVRSAVADALDIPVEHVRIITFEASGCYGRNGSDPATVDAALMSQLVGQPVRVQWMRHDEHGWDPKGPATVHQLRGGLDESGEIVGWDHEAWIPAFFETTIIGSVLAGRAARMPSLHLWEDPILYDIPASRQLAHYQGDIGSTENDGVGLISAWIRSPVQLQLTFASESFLDELAAAAGADPVELRLKGLSDPRMIAVLQAAARAAKWQTRPSPGPAAHAASGVARGRGVATSLRGGTYNAAVAEIEVDRESGQIRVDHMIVVQDNGMTINPRALKLGIEANVVQTVSRALYEEVTFDRSNVTSLDWNDYSNHPLHGGSDSRRDRNRAAERARHGLRRAVLQPDRPRDRQRRLRRRRRPPPQPADDARPGQSGTRRKRDELRGLDLRAPPADGGHARRLARDVLDRGRRAALGRDADETLSLNRVAMVGTATTVVGPGRHDRFRDLARDPARRLPGLGRLGDRGDRSSGRSPRWRCCAPSSSMRSRPREHERSSPPARPVRAPSSQR